MIDVTPWDFTWHGSDLLPTDEALNRKAVSFCRHFLTGHLDPRFFYMLWVAHEDGRVVGVTGVQHLWDIAVFRTTDERASDAMAIRLNAYFADQGMRGHTVFLSLPGGQSCPRM